MRIVCCNVVTKFITRNAMNLISYILKRSKIHNSLIFLHECINMHLYYTAIHNNYSRRKIVFFFLLA